MKITVLFLLWVQLFGDALYFKFCTKDPNTGCLIYRSDSNDSKTLKSLPTPQLKAKNGNISFLDRQIIDRYAVFLYNIEYDDFLLIEPVKLNGIKSKEMRYSFTDHEYKDFDDFLGYGSFFYHPAEKELQKFKKNLLISLYGIFPIYFFILIIYQILKRNRVLEEMELQQRPSDKEEARKFYRYLMLKGLPSEIEEFNKKIGIHIFEQKRRKKGQRKRKINIEYVQKAFDSFIDRYTGANKTSSHLKRVFLLYLWSTIVLTSWVYISVKVTIFIAVLSALFIIWMYLS